MMEMRQDTKDKLFPVAFFLDTNILRELPDNLVSGQFSQFMSAAQQLRQEVVVEDYSRSAFAGAVYLPRRGLGTAVQVGGCFRCGLE